jgi:hypothetical protein
MILQIRGDGQFAPVQGRIAQAVNACVGINLQGDEVPSGARDEYFGIGNLQTVLLMLNNECN